MLSLITIIANSMNSEPPSVYMNRRNEARIRVTEPPEIPTTKT